MIDLKPMMGGIIWTWMSFVVPMTLSFFVQICDGYSNFNYASAEDIAYICDTLIPNHSAEAPGVAVEDTFPVTLHIGSSTYTPGTTKNISVSIQHTIGDSMNSERTLKGFIIQARWNSSKDTPGGIGTWLPNEYAEVLNCGGNSTAIVQKNGTIGKHLPITVMFNAPATDRDNIIFVASWVEDLSKHSQNKFFSAVLASGAPCDDSPCNGGNCTEDDTDVYGRNHTCTCKLGSTGINCETLVCSPNPCENGGTCRLLPEDEDQDDLYFCQCNTGYSGKNCAEERRCETSNIQCLNGGVCNDDVNEPFCNCANGYGGVHCEHDIEPPEIICADVNITRNGLYEYTLSPKDLQINITDNERDYFFSFSPFSVQIGSTIGKITAEDLSGNVNTCSFTIVLKDTIQPDLMCPNDTLYTTMPGESEASILLPNASASDNFSKVNVTNRYSFIDTDDVPLGTYNITVTAEDEDGNNNSCYYMIGVENPQLLYVVFSVNESFVESLNDASSPEYEAFSLTVQESVEEEITKTSFASAYSGFVVANLRPGSITVSGVLMMNSNTNLSEPSMAKNLTNTLNESIIENGKLGGLNVIAGSFVVSDNVCVLIPCLHGGICLGGEVSNVSCNCSGTGYKGQICGEKINYCMSNPCQNGGTCLDGAFSFNCACSVDFTGDTCQTVVDHCATASCQNNGTCMSGANGMYTCNCTVDFTGDNCERAVDHCACNPCTNGGSCTSGTGGRFTCACTAGFTGMTCETTVDLCENGPCQNGGSCESGAEGYTCACTADFTGQNCTDIVDHCAIGTPCNNGGTCNLEDGGGYTCECAEGFTGATCDDQADPCNPDQCENGATCMPNGRNFTCLCEEGFIDKLCQTIDPCKPNPCLNDGTCAIEEGTFICMCGTGFNGATCNEVPCDSSPCQNDGTCSNVGDGFICSCATGFIGDTCNEDDSCVPNPCQNGGVCTIDESGYICNCSGTSYTGTECQTEVDVCNPNPCLNGGACVGVNMIVSCSCPDGFDGNICQNEVVTACSSEPCQNGGTCEVDGESYNCSCAAGWEGNNCQIDSQPCDPNPCENNNTCVVMPDPGQYNCSCGEKWGGIHCEIDIQPCDSLPCKNNGSCQYIGGGDFNCTCDEVEWTGTLCEIDLTPCNPNPCFDMGTCTEGPAQETFNCTCNETEWTGQFCEIDVTPCDPLPCLNGGNCTELGPGNYSCICEENEWTGDNCEIDRTPCDPLPCENSGTCTEGTEVGTYSCNCSEKWGGHDCNIYLLPCELSPCQNGATCQNGPEPGAYNCNCTGYWEGKNCSILAAECTTNPCQNGGTCFPSSDGFSEVCQCTSEYEGNRCETVTDPVNECSSNPCQNGGICRNLLDRYTCTCDTRYQGTNCETDTLDNSAQTSSSGSLWIVALCICFLIIIGIAAIFVCVSMSKKSSR